LRTLSKITFIIERNSDQIRDCSFSQRFSALAEVKIACKCWVCRAAGVCSNVLEKTFIEFSVAQWLPIDVVPRERVNSSSLEGSWRGPGHSKLTVPIAVV
jgi:hypothetical protein